MDRTRWQRIEDVYHAALARLGPERASFLAKVCAGDEALRREVETLLEVTTIDTQRLGGSPLTSTAQTTPPDLQVPMSARISSPFRISRTLPEGSPSRWGAFELLEKVGQGAFGTTFRVHDTRLDREVALKLLKSGASVDAVRSAQVVREGAMMARVRHRNVVTVYGAEFINTQVGVVMEFIRGRTLETMLKDEGALPAREATMIGVDLCSAVSAVHRAGIIHRDIKSSNVMQEEGGRIVLMDFGSGLDLERLGEQAATIAGTPLYMAPELFRNEPATARSDIYSIGVLLYRLVTDRYPLTAGSLDELCEAHEHRLHEGLPDAVCPVGHEAAIESGPSRANWKTLRHARKGLPDQFVQVVERCLSPIPERRYTSAAALEAALAGAVADLTAYRHSRIREWSQPSYRLDKEFVSLSLLVDQGEQSIAGRWSSQPERYQDLLEVLALTDDPAFVLLGPPGSGKSTLLRRLELDMASAALAGKDVRDTVTFFIQLNHYRSSKAGEPLLDPAEWLSERWQARFPDLPRLPSLLDQGRVILLLDALNEMPSSGLDGVFRWKEFLQRLVSEHRGNRVVFSCRTLDYSAPLSTPSLRVPQVAIAPLTDAQVEQFLMKRSPRWGVEIWSRLRGTPQLDVMRWPYLLTLLSDQVQSANEIPRSRARLFTGFVRQALRREVERDNPLFIPDGVITERDARQITLWQWKTPSELPNRGALVPKLSDLAFAMQVRSQTGGASHLRLGNTAVLDLLASKRANDIVKAGVALSVLDEDPANDEVLFTHQLIQEYFAGRRLAANHEPELVQVASRTDDVEPLLTEVLRSLPPAETIPSLPTTGWEETMLLAAEMTSDPDDFVRGLMRTNLALAGRCAQQVEVRERLSASLLDELRTALVSCISDREQDLRSRIAAGLTLGPLGDSRFERRRGPYGDYLIPTLIAIDGGRYPIGEDAPFGSEPGGQWADHMPRHEVDVAPFQICRFPVTNSEWAHFMESGGYEDERWWDTPSALRWQQGDGTADANVAQVRFWFDFLRQAPSLMEKKLAAGLWTQKTYENWKTLVSMTVAEFENHLREQYPGGKLRAPVFWHRDEANNPSQPVVGVCWFEARAYANWLTAQTGETFRLPTEVEWEAAARGLAGRAYSYGNEFDSVRGNTVETRIRRTTPVGVFPQGDTPEGVSDLTGNVSEWTGSLYGPVAPNALPTFEYPYRSSDGREDAAAGQDVSRVLRGGSWIMTSQHARAACRLSHAPGFRYYEVGFRLLTPGERSQQEPAGHLYATSARAS